MVLYFVIQFKTPIQTLKPLLYYLFGLLKILYKLSGCRGILLRRLLRILSYQSKEFVTIECADITFCQKRQPWILNLKRQLKLCI